MKLINVYPFDHPMLTVRDLRERGWTEGLAERYLGKPDDWMPVNYWLNFTGARAWALDRIERVEATPEFERSFLRSVRRRKLDAETVDAVLARLREFRRIGRDKSPPLEADYRDRLIAVAAREIESARARGYRTPHK
jgi:hypothetical protein